MYSKVLTVDDLAARWSMDAETLYVMARRRILIALSLNKKLYVSRDHVEYFEENGMTDLRREHLVE